MSNELKSNIVIEIKVRRLTIQYILISVLSTCLILWINKEWYWKWCIYKLGLDRQPIIVTSILEEPLTYLKFAFLGGCFISLISIIGRSLQYIIKAIYKKNLGKLISISLIFIIINWLIYPIICQYMSYLLLSSQEVVMLGKMNQYMEYFIGSWILTQLIWILPTLLSISYLREIYIKNRYRWIYILAIIISVITPPDLLLMTIRLCILIFIIESLLFIIIFRQCPCYSIK